MVGANYPVFSCVGMKPATIALSEEDGNLGAQRASGFFAPVHILRSPKNMLVHYCPVKNRIKSIGY
jgi:hypothetical protein